MDGITFLKSRQVDTGAVEIKETPMLTIGNEIIGTEKNFGVITGSPKSGKSRFLGAFISAAITGFPKFQIEVNIPAGTKIAHFDTEQGDADIRRMLVQIKTWAMIKKLPTQYDLFSFREDNPDQIKEAIEIYLKKNKTSFIILDGLLDLLFDYNDVRESRVLMNWIKKISKDYSLFILAIIHLGKSEQHTLGHIGSMCDRYCQSVLSSEKETDGSFSLKPRLLRSSVGFAPVNVIYDQKTKTWTEGFFKASDNKITQPAPNFTSDIDHSINLGNIFDGKGEKTYPDLLQAITEIYGCSKLWGKTAIKYLIKRALLKRSSTTGNYFIS